MVWYEFLTDCREQPSHCLLVSFLEFVKVFINCKPSLPNQFLIIEIFSSSVNSYIFILKFVCDFHFEIK